MKIMNRLWVILFVALLLTSIPFVIADEGEPEEDTTITFTGVEQVEGYQVNVVQVIIGLLGAFAAGGVVGIAGLAIFVDRIRNDSATVTALEMLAKSFPPETRELLLNVSTAVTSLGELGREVLDDIPVLDKNADLPLPGES